MRPVIIFNPRTDADFVAAVQTLARTIPGDPTVLADSLRCRFPAVVVRVRMSVRLAGSIWYVYRDGHWSDK